MEEWFKLQMAPDGRTGSLWIFETPKTWRYIGAVKIGYCQKTDSGEFLTVGTLESTRNQ